MKRESVKMQESDWRRLEALAAATGSIYSGKPSWRRMMLRIARGEITVRSTKRVARRANACMSESPTNDVNREGGTKRANGDSLHAEVMPRQQH